MSANDALRAALEPVLAGLPDEAAVTLPVGWLRSKLDGEGGTADAAVDMTVAQVGEALDRSPSTIRGWCAAGRIPGAFKLNRREWRVPRASLRRFLDAEAQKASSEHDESTGEAVDLGRWRRHMGATD